MRYSQLFRQTILLYKRYHSILMVVFLYPTFMIVSSFFQGSLNPLFLLMPGLFLVLWSLSMVITNIFATLPGDLRSLMIFPLDWTKIIIARNGILFLSMAVSILLALFLVSIMYESNSSFLLSFLVHSGVVLTTALGVGNILSARSPRPFRQSIFSWKGLVMIIVPVLANGLLVISSSLGALWYAVTASTSLLLSCSFYRLSVWRTSEHLQNAVHRILGMVDE